LIGLDLEGVDLAGFIPPSTLPVQGKNPIHAPIPQFTCKPAALKLHRNKVDIHGFNPFHSVKSVSRFRPQMPAIFEDALARVKQPVANWEKRAMRFGFVISGWSQIRFPREIYFPGRADFFGGNRCLLRKRFEVVVSAAGNAAHE
jgi:hypothetical protein